MLKRVGGFFFVGKVVKAVVGGLCWRFFVFFK